MQDLTDQVGPLPQLQRALAHGGELVGDVPCQQPLALDAADAGGLAPDLDLLDLGRRREDPVEGEYVADVRVAGVVPRDPCRVRDRRPDDRIQLFGRGEQRDHVVLRLGHLGDTIQPQHPPPGPDQRIGLRKQLAVSGVPPAGDLTRQLQVLALVLAHGDEVRPVQQDVGGLQDGVVQEAGAHALDPLRLLLELGHPLEITQGRHRVEEPRELGVLRDVRLNEQRAAVRLQSARDEGDGQVQHPPVQLLGLVGDRDGVEVHDAVDALVALRQLHPVLDRPEVVPQVDVSGRLNAAEYSSPGFRHAAVKESRT